ncbi:hypothetical protein PoB_006739000 [Plakobranchus ocellatus]|uniref:Uncharacterized protein n=1 Tax=Plakobranchus ocellatus TaxID=259542 RepID=A0AAV4D9V9_9GAST|nr:hypothetical protein PoB_006739000 [Plakobranchus ocellatus]
MIKKPKDLARQVLRRLLRRLHQEQEGQQSHQLILPTAAVTIDTPETAATATDNPKTLQNSLVILKAAYVPFLVLKRHDARR